MRGGWANPPRAHPDRKGDEALGLEEVEIDWRLRGTSGFRGASSNSSSSSEATGGIERPVSSNFATASNGIARSPAIFNNEPRTAASLIHSADGSGQPEPTRTLYPYRTM